MMNFRQTCQTDRGRVIVLTLIFQDVTEVELWLLVEIAGHSGHHKPIRKQLHFRQKIHHI